MSIEEGIRKEAEKRVECVMERALDAIRPEVYGRIYGENIFSIATQADLNEVVKLVVNALAGDVVSKETLVEKVTDTAIKRISARAIR